MEPRKWLKEEFLSRLPDTLRNLAFRLRNVLDPSRASSFRPRRRNARGVVRSRTGPIERSPPQLGGLFVFPNNQHNVNYAKLNGLIPAVVQDAETSEVPMVGFMNEQALAATRRAGFATFFSRTRGRALDQR